MNVSNLSEALIRQHATGQSFHRGEHYYHQGAVISLAQRGDTIQAKVEGSQYEPYSVRVAFDAGGITDATCDCPYDWGGWCKHIVATLLACLHEPDSLETRPPLDELLANLDQEQLQDLLLQLAQNDVYITEQVETQIALLQAASEPAQPAGADETPTRHTSLDPQPIRRQVYAILHSLDRMRPSEAYWHVGSVVDEISRLLDQAWSFIEDGDGRNALIFLEAVTDEYVENWYYLDGSSGETGDFFDVLGAAWTEACLVADLSPQEREAWAQKLADWQAEVDDYGVDNVFEPAQDALLQGWDDPQLQRALQGKGSQPEIWDEEPAWQDDALTLARLNVLERQERYQEYLHLAEAEGQIERYSLMLVRLGRVEEAVERGLQAFHTPIQCLNLAKALRQQGKIDASLQVAEHGLSLQGLYKGTLATWLRDLAEGSGKTELALRAAVAAFRSSPSLIAYQRVQALSGERWPELKTQLLAYLREGPQMYDSGSVDVFLHEGLVDDAIAAVEQGASYDTLERVVDAAIEHRPDWVIRVARQQAMRIIEPGKAKHYHHAVNWLDKAQAAYLAAGRQADWYACLADIHQRHGRKYKLMGLLERLE